MNYLCICKEFVMYFFANRARMFRALPQYSVLAICAILPLTVMGARSTTFAQTTPLTQQDKVSNSSAQEAKCNLTIAQAPALRGFRLGMSVKDFKARFPSIEVRSVDEVGRAKAEIYINDRFLAIDKSEFKDVESLSLLFSDDRLESISVRYDSKIHWDSAAQFVSAISPALGLPSTWKTIEWWQKSLDCDGFRVTAGTGVITFIKLEALVDRQSREERLKALADKKRALEKEKEERQQREEQERRAAFKP